MIPNMITNDKKRFSVRPSDSCAKNADSAKTRFSGAKRRILVMDDDPTVREVAALMLKALGYSVYAAEGSEEAIECYRQASVCGFPFHAVLLDTNIPYGVEGNETVGRLYGIDPQVRAVAMSGILSDPGITDIRAYGFCSTLMKPFTLNELELTLNCL